MLEDEQEQKEQPVIEEQVAQQLPSITPQQQAESQIGEDTTPVIQPEVTDRFPNRRGPQGATSKVDLSKPGAEDEMWKQYNKWFRMPRNAERATLENLWYNTYYGMDTSAVEAYKKENAGIYGSGGNPFKVLDNTLKGLSVPGLAYADFGMDAIGNLPGAGGLDNLWDKQTKLDNPFHQRIRRMLSVILPSIHSGRFVAGQMMAPSMMQLSKPLRLAIGAGAFGAQEAAIIGLSDEGEEENLTRILSDTFPGVFGEKGYLPIPDWIKVRDSDSPSVRRYKNMLENTVLSLGGTTLGAFLEVKGGKRVMGWMEPLDEAAVNYKQTAITEASDTEKIVKLQQLQDELDEIAEIDSIRATELFDEIETLKSNLDITESIDDVLRREEDTVLREQSDAARGKIARGATDADFDPDITPVLGNVDNPRPIPPPGAVARNMADVAATKMGISVGDNAPMLTEAMRQKGLMLDAGVRDSVVGLAEEARDLGRFNALVDGFRFSNKQMDAAAWDIYSSILAADNMDDVRGLFLENKDVKNMLLGRFKVEYINEEQARAAAFAMRDLIDRYLGRHIANMSARLMDTLGKEVTTLSEAIQELEPFISTPKQMELIIDKLQFLMDEYALNKYIAGWALKNKDWFNRLPPGSIDEAIEGLSQTFRAGEKAIHSKNLNFTKTLLKLSEENPMMMRPLVDAWSLSGGDVDTLAKLNAWAMKELTPWGAIKSPNPREMNLFARSLWGVRMNNVLSGVSPLNAGKGNSFQLIARPITGLMGHGIWGVTDGFEGFKRTMYYNSSVQETNVRALGDAWKMIKKAHKDPELMKKAYRKDLKIFQDDAKWAIIEDLRPAWEASNDVGKLWQANVATTLKEMGNHPALRYGMTAMVGPDAFTWTHIATHLSRMRAYDDVFSEFGFADWKKIAAAEKKHYKNMFDENGLLKDDIAKALSGEITLNLDDGLATWINEATTAYPVAKDLFMFPRTQSNWVKNAISWTPISAIPGINKYAKTIWAQTDDDIAKALAEHGIDMATEPYARVLFENLRAEYTGRMAFTGILSTSLWGYAMAGNIRGSGHYNADRRKKERTEFGYEPNTINIAGKWFSFKGLPGIEQVLTIMGDMAYYASDIDAPIMKDLQAKLWWTLNSAFLGDTPLYSIEPLIEILNGNVRAFNRFVSNALWTYTPASSGLSVLAKSIDSAQKDIEGSILELVMNKAPGLRGFLPDQKDFWTGKSLNDVDNPFLRVLNAVSPIKFSGTREPWRVWLQEIGWSGMHILKKHSNGHEYTNHEREWVYEELGKMELWKELIPLMNDKTLNKQAGYLRAHRATGQDLDNTQIKLRTELLPLHQRINAIIKRAKAIVEARYIVEFSEQGRETQIRGEVDSAMKLGDVQRAHELQKEDIDNQKLLKYNSNRR